MFIDVDEECFGCDVEWFEVGKVYYVIGYGGVNFFEEGCGVVGLGVVVVLVWLVVWFYVGECFCDFGDVFGCCVVVVVCEVYEFGLCEFF